MKWVVPFMHVNAYRMNKDKVNMLIAFKVFSSFLLSICCKMCVADQFLVLISFVVVCCVAIADERHRSAYGTQLFCLYTWYLWANDEILYSSAAICMCQLIDVMLCCAVFDLLLFSCATFFEMKKKTRRLFTQQRQQTADNRQHSRTRMVCISFSFFTLSFDMRQDQFSWFGILSLKIWIHFFSLSIQSVPKASNWSQKDQKKKSVHDCALSVSGPFWKSLCRQIKPKFIENNERENSIPKHRP